MNITDVLSQIFTPELAKQLLGLVVLCVLDVVLGLVAALRTGTFDLQKMANFYKSTVLPFFLGWMVLYVAVKMIAIYVLEDIAPIVPTSVMTGAYAIILIVMGAGLVDKFKLIWGTIPGQKS